MPDPQEKYKINGEVLLCRGMAVPTAKPQRVRWMTVGRFSPIKPQSAHRAARMMADADLLSRYNEMAERHRRA